MSKRLIEYLSPFSRQFEENKIITSVEQIEIDRIWELKEEVLNEQFVESASINGVSKWERILNVTPKGTEKLTDRKFRILARLNEQLPYTVPKLNEQLKNLCGENGYNLELDYENYNIRVKVALTAKNNYTDVADLLNRVVPANMIVDLTLMYNQHKTLKQFKHSELKRFKHGELRNEVI